MRLNRLNVLLIFNNICSKMAVGGWQMHSEVLKGVQLFSELSDDQLLKFSEIAEEKAYNSGEIILEQGIEGNALYVVKQGQVEIAKTDAGANSTIVTLESGEHFGEMSLLEGQPTSARVKADGEVKILVIPRNKFLSLLDGNVDIAAIVYKSLAFSLSRRLRTTSTDLATWKPSFEL